MSSRRTKYSNPFRTIKIKQEPADDNSRQSSVASKLNESSQSPLYSFRRVKQEFAVTLPSYKVLELNRSARKVLKNEIAAVEAALAKIRENLEIETENYQKASTKTQKPLNQIRAVSAFVSPYFRDGKRMAPPHNEDTITKMRNNDVTAYLEPPRPWTPAEQQSLLDGITAYTLLNALKPYKHKKDFIKNKLKEDKNLTDAQIEDLKMKLNLIQEEIKEINKMPLNQLFEMLDGKIDWLTISATNMQGVRSPEECEIMWNNVLSFTINKDTFTESEDEKLFEIAEEFDERNWEEIAKALNTQRTAVLCFERYQTRLSYKLKKKYWTKEEDELLMQLVEKHKTNGIILWNKISIMMEGRTRQQIINRYERTVSQQYNRGPWTPEEDAMLIACYQKYGNRWNSMKPFFRNRSTYMIRERYCNALTPDIRVGPWSKEEDKLLIAMIRRYGYGRWSKICTKLPGRTDNMCLIRAGRLLEWSVKYHSERGTGEYDTGVNDPEMFARILRPCAPSKYCPIRNERVRSYRENGLKYLVKALDYVAPEYKANLQDHAAVDVSWMSEEMLQGLSTKLHEFLDTRLDGGVIKQHPVLKYITKPPLKRKRLERESDDEDYVQIKEKPIPREEKELIDSALNNMFKMHSSIMNPVFRKTQVYSSRQLAEMSLYKAYLYKQFQCKALCDEGDDLENVVFNGHDYRETLQTVVSHFIQPPVYDNQFMVLAPSVTTMTGMETLEATENRLLSMSECVSHSKSYIDYLCERRQSSPQCLQCLHRSGKSTSTTTPESVKSNMKKRSFLPNEVLEKAAYVEGGSIEKLDKPCSCKALADSLKSVQLLRKRFLSLFLFPSLLSATEFTKDHEHMICNDRSNATNYFYNTGDCPTEMLPFNGRPPKRNGKRETRAAKKRKTETQTAPKIKTEPKPEPIKRTRRKKSTPSAPVRRSSRLSVLNRKSSAFQGNDDQNSTATRDLEESFSLPEEALDILPSSANRNIEARDNVLPEESCDNMSLSSEENRNNSSILQDEENQSDIPLSVEEKKDGVLLLQETKKENVLVSEENTNDTLVLQENDDNDLELIGLDKSNTPTLQNNDKKNENNVSTLFDDSADSVLILQEKSKNATILPKAIINNQSAVEDKDSDSMIEISRESKDSELVIEEIITDSPASPDMIIDSAGISKEGKDIDLVIEENITDSPASPDMIMTSPDIVMSSSSDNIVTPSALAANTVIPSSPSVVSTIPTPPSVDTISPPPSNETIASSSPTSADNSTDSESETEERFSDCVLELTEKSIKFG